MLRGNELSIKETQTVSLEILHTIAEICEKKGFRYALIYGTLIGAVRHHDYIPWDDDVDIMMPRPDYDKLLDYLRVHISEYPNLKMFNREECREYPYMITRISDDRYEIVMNNEKPFGMGVFIDIYPYDGLGQTKEEAVKYGLRGDRMSSLCYQATREHFAIETTTSLIRKIIKFPVYVFSKMIGKEYFQNKLEKLARVKDYDSSEYIGCVIWLSGVKKIFFHENGLIRRLRCRLVNMNFVFLRNMTRCFDMSMVIICSFRPKKIVFTIIISKYTKKVYSK